MIMKYQKLSHTADKPVAPLGRALQQSQHTRTTNKTKKLSLPHHDDCKTRMNTKKHRTKHRTIQNPTMGVTINNNF